MYVFNDIRLVIKLSNYKLLKLILAKGPVAIARMRLQQCDFHRRQQILVLSDVLNLDIDDCDAFDAWSANQSQAASKFDLATLYVAKTLGDAIMILSPRDLFLHDVCDDNDIAKVNIDDMMQEVADERTLKVYNLVQNNKMEE